jgi:gamma-glutamylcyclotransferase (GGCT)/AIG2-like uncharacterized protein YtfP
MFDATIDLVDPPIGQVFCYGTLLPGEERWGFLEPFVLSHEADQVTGRLFDTGLGYPAARFDHIGVIHGRTFTLDPVRRDEALALLDEIEGAVEGLYHRISIVTALGRRAHAYQYGGGVSNLVSIRDGNWLTR